ncbi:MAG: CDC48 family AAA ATPase [archaeon]
MPKEEIKLKVAEAIQEDINKGIVRIGTDFLKQIDVRPGSIVEVVGERTTVAIADRALPGDMGLNIIRTDPLIRRNAKTSIGEVVIIRKADVKEAKTVTIAPAREGIMIKANTDLFKNGLLGRPIVKGDIVSLGGTQRRRNTLAGHPFFDEMFSMLNETAMGFGLGDLKFVVVNCEPKQAVLVTENTKVSFISKAVDVSEEKAIDVSYEDIGGLDEELKKVREMIELPLKHPEIFERLGIEAPKGVLLHGPPGTGKTLLAKAVANETNANFILINGPEIMSKFYGQSEENLRNTFKEAEEKAPSIIFIDEIDAIASKREESKGEVEKRVVAQLLALMDGLKTRGKVVVIAATNIPNVLDPALRRPGRFDRELEIGVPNEKGRLAVMKIHTRNMPILGSLYGDIVQKNLIELIDQREIELDSKIKSTQEELNARKKEKVELENELKEKQEEREAKKKRAEESSFARILNEIDSRISHIKSRFVSLEKEINSKTLEIESSTINQKELKDIKTKLHKDKNEIINITNEIINCDEQLLYLPRNDPRIAIIERNQSELYKKLKKQNLTAGVIKKSRTEGVPRDLEAIASITYGFVGADLSSLAREAAMIVLRREIGDATLSKSKGSEEETIPEEVLERLILRKTDFQEALKVVRPSALREVLIEIPNVRWGDIGGLDNVKQELIEAVEWPLKNKDDFVRMGVKPPKGVLIYGAPGTGKTLLAKAVANESKANFILVKGPELLSKWVGESEKAVRKVFEKARQTSPTIIFFDEIDSLAPRRGGGGGDDSHVTERVVNQLLTEMDGLQELNDIIIIGATNRPDIIDTALLRPGRFDRIILAPVPDKRTRKEIFAVHTKGMPLDKDVEMSNLIDQTESYVGADIESVCREAAIFALREDMKAKTIKAKHFELALAKVRPSATKDVEEAYADLEKTFRAARGKEMKDQKPSYYG